MTRTGATSRISLTLAAALAATLAGALIGCAPAAITAHSAKSDGVMFAYNLTPTPVAHRYKLQLDLKDAASGKAIDDAGVALDLVGPGLTEDGLVNLHRDPGASSPTYFGAVDLPEAATYRLTFQVNRRAPAASAQAVFSTPRPAG